MSAPAQTLRVAIPQEVANVTPYIPGVPETLLELVYDKLAGPSPYLGNATPWLATAIVPEGTDGRSWRITLRENVRWHDGRPFTSNDVVFTLRYYRDGIANRWTHHVSDTPKLTTIEALDRRSLRVGCENPCPSFDKVTAADIVILPAHLWQSVRQPHLYRGPLIGTGPYRVAELAPGRFLRLEANRDYFAGAPLAKQIVVSFIRNPATAFAALRAGELDLVAAPVPPELLGSLARQKGLAVRSGGNQLLYAVEMRINFDRSPFNNPEFRRAVAYAISPEEVLQRVALGHGQPGTHYPAPASPWTKPGLEQLSDDRPKAKAIFDRLGKRNRRFGLKVSSSEPLHQRAAQVVARQLGAAGLDVHVEVVDPARMRALYTARQFDFMIAEVTPHNLADPDQLIVSLVGGYLWREGLPDAEMKTLIANWKAASTASERIQAGYALQELHARAPATLMLYYPSFDYAYRPAAYDRWRAVPGLGVFHKWSLLP
jgi:peptide/nickel transport system substrate-binding protein